jgi:hypothetical protein
MPDEAVEIGDTICNRKAPRASVTGIDIRVTDINVSILISWNTLKRQERSILVEPIWGLK